MSTPPVGPQPRTTLRAYQAQALDQIRDLMRGGVRRALLVSPTGSGKGTLVASLIQTSAAKGKRVLFIVKGRTLVAEFSDRLRSQYGVPHGVIMGEATRTNSHWTTQVCSIDTLASWVKRGRALPEADLIVIDEADESVAPKWESVLALYPRAYVLGQTATPIRSDGKGLDRWFDQMVVAADVETLIEQRYLSDFDGFRFVPDLNDDELAEARASDKGADRVWDRMGDSRRAKLCGSVVSTWHEYAPGRPTVGFAINRAHSRAIVERFNNERVHGAPICVAVHLDGETPLEERYAIRQRMERGEVQLVSSVGVLGRGVDWPVLQVAAVWRPTKSLAWHIQACGRVLRTHDCRCGAMRYLDHGPGVACGACGSRTKPKALFLDHVDNMKRHGHPGLPRDWSLKGMKKRKRGPVEPPVRACKECLAEYVSRSKKCPRCGWSPPVPPPKPAQHDESAALGAVDIRAKKLVAPEERARRGLYALVADALERGRTADSAVPIWHARFPAAALPTPSDLARIERHLRARWASNPHPKHLEPTG